MKALRTPNGSGAGVWPQTLLDMETNKHYAYVTTFGMMRKALIRAGLDLPTQMGADDLKVMVYGRTATSFRWNWL